MHQTNPLSFQSGTGDPPDISPDFHDLPSSSAEPTTATEARSGNLLSEHKGKLAMGAAAMLGIAIFYKWREHRLAKEDPEQYAQLKRIKSAVRENGSKPGPND